MSITVLIADDEPLVRAGLRAVLEAQPDIDVVGEASDGAAVVPLVRQLRPDVVAMDVRMPILDGIEATRQVLRTVHPSPRILVVTTFENDEYVYQALQAGADGFFAPGLADEGLIEALCSAVALPVNIIALPGVPARARLAELGVARISHGPVPWKKMAAWLEAQAREAISG